MEVKQFKRIPGTPDPMHVWQMGKGVYLAGDSWGEPGDPLILLLHGGGQTRHSWRGTGESLAARGFYVVAFDARGHGDSSWPSDGVYDQDAFVEDLRALIDKLGYSKAALVGASLGGNTALAAAGDGVVDVSALVLVDVVPRIERGGFERIKKFMADSSGGFQSLQEASSAIGRYKGEGKPIGKGISKNLRRGEDGRFYWHWDPRFLDGREADYAKRYERLSRCARSITAPVLLVRGIDSDVVSDEGAGEFLKMCRYAECITVPSAGHMVVGDDNGIFGDATLDFLLRTAI